jgi:hypothetical protein
MTLAADALPSAVKDCRILTTWLSYLVRAITTGTVSAACVIANSYAGRPQLPNLIKLALPRAPSW